MQMTQPLKLIVNTQVKAHKLQINVQKSKYIVFETTTSKEPHEPINIDGHIIQNKKEIKYLGVILDSNLTFQKQVNSITQKMATGIKTIYSIRNQLRTHTTITIMKALVLSHINYSGAL